MTLIWALSVPAVALAANSAKTRERAAEKAAKKACAAGDFRKGVEILADLYVSTDDETFIYNQGRCYEQNHQWVSAIDRFREYLLKSPATSLSERAQAEKHIADCEALLEKEEAKQAAVSHPIPLSEPVAVPVPTVQPPPPDNVVIERPVVPVPEKSRGAGLRITGVVLAAVGVATAATGLVLNLKANSLADDFNKNQNPSTRSSQSTYKTGSVVCYAAGAGVLVTGIVVYLIGLRASDQQTRVSLLSVTATELSLGLRRTF